MKKENAFESAVYNALSRCSHRGVLLAAVSGGADSTAMLLAAAEARARLGFVLHCLHVDHGIRPQMECAADAASVQELCASLAVPCAIVPIERGAILKRARTEKRGIEAAAREYRHAAWAEEACRVGAQRVLVGHTLDDLLETALIRFLRGAGPTGLSAMAEERGIVFRPLLSLSRTEVLAYLSSQGVSFRTDSTNTDLSYFRNRVRLRLVPLLDGDFPLWRSAVTSLVRTQTEAAAFIAGESAGRIVWKQEDGGITALSTDEELFFSQPAIIRQEALYTAIDRLVAVGAGRGPAGLSVDSPRRRPTEPRRTVLRHFTSGTVRAADLGAVRAERRGGRIIVEPVRSLAAENGFSVVISEPGVYRAGPFTVTASLSSGDCAFSVRLPIILRPLAAEDRIILGGRTVSALRKVAASLQPEALVIVVEDREGIAAVLSTSGGGKQRILIRDQRNEGADYAQSVFFSILLQRGYHA